MPNKRKPGSRRSRRPQRADGPLRIIGGKLRGRPIRYDGDRATRPMKDRVREAVFNLVGPAVRDKLAIDLFSGTGAMGLEALSRGASRAVLIERRFPAIRVIEENAAHLGVRDQVDVVPGDAFAWARRHELETSRPWLVFCCPPYEFYISRRDDVLALCTGFVDKAPDGSLIVVESDSRFDTQSLPNAEAWDVRRYPPAVIAIWE